jgi:hypothetical protein
MGRPACKKSDQRGRVTRPRVAKWNVGAADRRAARHPVNQGIGCAPLRMVDAFDRRATPLGKCLHHVGDHGHRSPKCSSTSKAQIRIVGAGMRTKVCLITSAPLGWPAKCGSAADCKSASNVKHPAPRADSFGGELKFMADSVLRPCSLREKFIAGHVRHAPRSQPVRYRFEERLCCLCIIEAIEKPEMSAAVPVVFEVTTVDLCRNSPDRLVAAVHQEKLCLAECEESCRSRKLSGATHVGSPVNTAYGTRANR